jgi:hypothetical protein
LLAYVLVLAKNQVLPRLARGRIWLGRCLALLPEGLEAGPAWAAQAGTVGDGALHVLRAFEVSKYMNLVTFLGEYNSVDTAAGCFNLLARKLDRQQSFCFASVTTGTIFRGSSGGTGHFVSVLKLRFFDNAGNIVFDASDANSAELTIQTWGGMAVFQETLATWDIYLSGVLSAY